MVTKQISVVVIESQPMMRTALSTAISAEGMTVLAEVADSRNSVQTASNLKPDLILFSVNEPSLKDFERIFDLSQGLPNALIVALITGEFDWHFQAAQNYGAHIVLTKSTPRSEILGAIKKISNKEIYPANLQVDK